MSSKNMVILNEREYITEMLQKHELGNKPSNSLFLAACYYRTLGYSSADIEELLKKYLVQCDPDINVVQWQESIDFQIKRSNKRPLIEIDSVPITQFELDVCDHLQKPKMRKLMFALFCLAKLEHIKNPDNDGWVNTADKDVFSMANVSATIRAQSLMLNDLMQMGYVEFSKKIDNVNTRVVFMDVTSAPAMQITDFRNLGNQYLMRCGEPYVKCEGCGLVVRRRGNAHKLCEKCANERTRENKRKNREKSKMS